MGGGRTQRDPGVKHDHQRRKTMCSRDIPLASHIHFGMLVLKTTLGGNSKDAGQRVQSKSLGLFCKNKDIYIFE